MLALLLPFVLLMDFSEFASLISDNKRIIDAIGRSLHHFTIMNDHDKSHITKIHADIHIQMIIRIENQRLLMSAISRSSKTFRQA